MTMRYLISIEHYRGLKPHILKKLVVTVQFNKYCNYSYLLNLILKRILLQYLIKLKALIIMKILLIF